MTDDFKALIDSLGNASLGLLSGAVEAVRVRFDEFLSTATVSIILCEDTWDNRLTALARADEIRSMFLDELVLDFVFEGRGDLPVRDDAPGVNAVLTFA